MHHCILRYVAKIYLIVAGVYLLLACVYITPTFHCLYKTSVYRVRATADAAVGVVLFHPLPHLVDELLPRPPLRLGPVLRRQALQLVEGVLQVPRRVGTLHEVQDHLLEEAALGEPAAIDLPEAVRRHPLAGAGAVLATKAEQLVAVAIGAAFRTDLVEEKELEIGHWNATRDR